MPRDGVDFTGFTNTILLADNFTGADAYTLAQLVAVVA